MADDMELQLSFSYSKQELNSMLGTIHKEIENADLDPNITGDTKQQLKDLEKQVKSFAKAVNKDFDKISAIQLDSKAFDQYVKITDKRLDGLEKTVMDVIDTLRGVDSSTDLSNIGKAFDNLKAKVESNNTAIKEMVDTATELGAKVKLDVSTQSAEYLSGMVKEAKELKQALMDADDTAENFGEKDFKEAYKNLQAIHKEYQETVAILDKIDDENSFEYLKTEIKANKLYNERLNTAEKIRDMALQNEELEEKHVKAYESIEKLVPSTQFQIAEKRIDALISKIEKLYSRAKSAEDASIVSSSEIDGNQGQVSVKASLKITTTTDQMFDVIKKKLEQVQKRLNEAQEALVVPVRYILGNKRENTENELSVNKQEIKEVKKAQDEVALNFDKVYSQIEKRAISNATKAAKQSITTIQNEMNKNPVEIKFDIPESETKRVSELLASNYLDSKINIGTILSEAVASSKELLEIMQKVYDTGNYEFQAYFKRQTQEVAKAAQKGESEETPKTTEEIKEQTIEDAKAMVKQVQEVFNDSKIKIKLVLEKEQLDRVKDKLSDANLDQSIHLVEELKQATSYASELAESLNSINKKSITIKGAANSEQEIGEIKTQVQTLLAASAQLDTKVKSIQTSLKNASKSNNEIKEISVDFEQVTSKVDELISTIKALVEDLRLDISIFEAPFKAMEDAANNIDLSVLERSLTQVWEMLLNISNTLDGLKSGINTSNLESYDSQWQNIAKTFHSVADYADDIDLRKSKTQLEEMLKAYKKYRDAGGTNSLDMLTSNISTLEKLQNISKRVNGNGFDIGRVDNAALKETTEVLEELNAALSSITSSLQSINGLENVSKTFNALNIGDKKLEQINKIPEALKKIADDVRELNNLPTSKFVEQISKIAEQGEGLKALADILKNSKDKIKAAMEITDANAQNKSYLKEQIKLMEAYKKQYDKALNKSDSEEYVASLRKMEEILGNIVKLESLENVTAEHIEEARQYNTLLETELTNQKNILEVEKQRTKEAEATAKAEKEALKRSINSELSKSSRYERDYTRKWGYGSIQGNYTSDYGTILDNIKNKLAEIETIRQRANSGIYSEDDVKNLQKMNKELENFFEELVKVYAVSKNTQISNMSNKIAKYLEKNTHLTDESRKKLEAYLAELNSGSIITHERLQTIAADFNSIQYTSRMAGREGTNFLDAIKNKLKYGWAQSIAMFFSFYDIVRYVREISSTVTELNSNLIELAKVSEASIGELYDGFSDFKDIAKETGGTINDIISSTADWARNGYNLPDSKELARLSSIFQNIGDGITEDQANEYLVSTLKGFNLEASQAIEIMDKINNVSNNAASGVQDIGEALERSSASFGAANTDLSESIALLTTANEVLQNPETVGTAFKSMSARLRAADTEITSLEDGFTLTTSKLRDLVQALTGYDIQETEDSYHSIYEILKGIGEEWDNLTDLQQASLSEELFG